MRINSMQVSNPIRLFSVIHSPLTLTRKVTSLLTQSLDCMAASPHSRLPRVYRLHWLMLLLESRDVVMLAPAGRHPRREQEYDASGAGGGGGRGGGRPLSPLELRLRPDSTDHFHRSLEPLCFRFHDESRDSR